MCDPKSIKTILRSFSDPYAVIFSGTRHYTIACSTTSCDKMIDTDECDLLNQSLFNAFSLRIQEREVLLLACLNRLKAGKSPFRRKPKRDNYRADGKYPVLIEQC